jgi:hypothetical protein
LKPTEQAQPVYDPTNPTHSPALRDFCVYTDGSGHADGYGGSAALVVSKDPPAVKRLVRAENGCSVARAEMSALLMGLHHICTLSGVVRPSQLKGKRPTVFWLSDRLDLVMTVAGVFEAQSNLDLWHHYRWYAQLLDVHAFHTKRMQHIYNAYTDELAGHARVLVKNLEAYLE